VARFFEREGQRFRGRRVLDLPTGSGLTSYRVAVAGGEPLPFDIFPETFEVEGLTCERADVLAGIPLEDASCDDAFCQEGIEHFTDQFRALCEFNRVLRPGGALFVTTPNYSSLLSRLSYLLTESERWNSRIPPNEADTVKTPLAESRDTAEVYFGHVFLIGIQKLRVLARAAGFRVVEVHPTRPRNGSLLLLPLLWPLVWLANAWIRRRMKRKHPHDAARHAIYDELFRLGTSVRVLTASHLFVEFEKERDWHEASSRVRGT
jgi:SAM-dependent methyltransferase